MPTTASIGQRPPSPAEVAYVAGFLDGEGSIVIRRARKIPGRRTGIDFRLQIQFAQNDIRPLKLIEETFGGKTYACKPRKPTHAPYFQLSLQSRMGCQRLLEATRPHLLVKKEQAELALRFLALPLFKNQWSRNPEIIEQRIALKNEMHAIKAASLKGRWQLYATWPD